MQRHGEFTGRCARTINDAHLV